jgi:hypothetical protein
MALSRIGSLTTITKERRDTRKVRHTHIHTQRERERREIDQGVVHLPTFFIVVVDVANSGTSFVLLVVRDLCGACRPASNDAPQKITFQN